MSMQPDPRQKEKAIDLLVSFFSYFTSAGETISEITSSDKISFPRLQRSINSNLSSALDNLQTLRIGVWPEAAKQIKQLEKGIPMSQDWTALNKRVS